MKADRLPSGAYRYKIAYYDTAGRRHFKSFTDIDRETAKRAATRFKQEHESLPVSSGSFSSMLARYIAAREPQLSPATIQGYRNIERRLSRDFPAFYEASAGLLTRDDVQLVLNGLSNAGASPKTVRNYSGLISAVFAENGITAARVSLPQKEARNVSVPSPDDVRALLRAADGTKAYIPIALAAFGGLRRGETCALRLSDIDFDALTVHVCRDVVLGVGNRWYTKRPKTAASDRYIVMPVDVIARIKAAGTIFDDSPRMLDYHFRRTQLAAFGEIRYRYHDLRHFCVSYMHSLGVPDSYIQKRCGFANDATLKAVYRHILADQERRYIDRTNAAFNSLIS